MPISKANKRKLISAFQSTRNKADEIEIELLVEGRTTEAKKVRSANNALTKEIRTLIREAQSDWAGSAAKMIKDVRRGNSRIQASIREIRRTKGVAKNVVKAVGWIDKAVEIAAKVLL